MRRTLWTLAAPSLVLVVLAAGWASVTLERDASRRRAFADGRIPLRVVDAAGHGVRLWRAGDTLEAPTPVALEGRETWLEAGRYFVEAGGPGKSLRFPVPLVGFQRGPDEDGAFAVTVRRWPVRPPRVWPGQQFVSVPAGHAAVGLAVNPGERHFVWVPGFYASAFEVTNEEFRAFLEDPAGAADRANWSADGWAWHTATPTTATATLVRADQESTRFGQDDQPVVLVSWFEADAFGRWLSRRLADEYWEYRLPTEAEWEKATRGPESWDYGLGMTLSEPQAGHYNWRKNPGAAVTVVGHAATLSGYRANGYGIYHASGNVAEWIRSQARPYSSTRPYRDDDRNDSEGSAARTTRGGSWYSATASRLLLGYREEFQPSLRSNDLGFRIVAVPRPAMPRAH